MGRRGEGRAQFEVDGKTFTAVLDFNTLADFEEETGENALARFAEVEARPLSARETRVLFWAALRECHPELSVRDAGRLLMAGQGALEAAMVSAFPPPEAPKGNARTRT